tara:strand:+ start:458 stop:1177 length:720 start_codon:yes stop_codon:yes gene_type:complete
MKKQCRTCKNLKSTADFNKNKRQKDGFQGACRTCTRTSFNKHYTLHKAKPLQVEREGFKTCTKCKQEQVYAEYSRQKGGMFDLASKCKQCASEDYSRWRINKGGKEWENSYVKRRKEEDPQYKRKYILRLRILDALKRYAKGGKVSRKHSAFELLGCDLNTVTSHIEDQFLPEMTWENHGTIWELDHIRPCASYDLLIEAQSKECFNYLNLQPLFKTTRIAERFGYTGYIGNSNKQDRY